MGRLYAGVDGGGTRTRAVVATVTAAGIAPVGRGASGPANASTTPLPRVVEAISEAVDDALEAAGAPREDLAALSCGVAGVEGSGSADRLVAAFSAVYPGAA
ncbi:MAG TPA: BadF/BadG/BcrA/BcrD ATPase family protein, partial [Thermoanaerobaculia bacterium]|nr:BadF/BadG/BcrA/BcrD ATPase family protein [Thermoanaerobaculia bacterium]